MRRSPPLASGGENLSSLSCGDHLAGGLLRCGLRLRSDAKGILTPLPVVALRSIKKNKPVILSAECVSRSEAHSESKDPLPDRSEMNVEGNSHAAPACCLRTRSIKKNNPVILNESKDLCNPMSAADTP